MKNLVCLLVFAMSLASCRKCLKDHDPEPASCRIATWESSGRTFVMYYDSEGRPDSLTSSVGGGGDAPHVFSYDPMGRLIEDRQPGFQSNIYSYTGDSRLPVSLLIQNVDGFSADIGFTYDSQGRLVAAAPKEPGTGEPSGPTINFYYDANGNRQPDPALGLPVLAYSDQPSVYSLDPTWQITGWDYSRNSRVALEYNSSGLPLRFPASTTGNFSRNDTYMNFDGAVLTYDCVSAAPKINN